MLPIKGTIKIDALPENSAIRYTINGVTKEALITSVNRSHIWIITAQAKELCLTVEEIINGNIKIEVPTYQEIGKLELDLMFNTELCDKYVLFRLWESTLFIPGKVIKATESQIKVLYIALDNQLNTIILSICDLYDKKLGLKGSTTLKMLEVQDALS